MPLALQKTRKLWVTNTILILATLFLLPACNKQEDAAHKQEKKAEEHITIMNNINKSLRAEYGIAVINDNYLPASIEVIKKVDQPEVLMSIKAEVQEFVSAGEEVQVIDNRDDVQIVARPQVDKALVNSRQLLQVIEARENQFYDF